MKWADRSLVLTLAIQNLDHPSEGSDLLRRFLRVALERQTPCRSEAVLAKLSLQAHLIHTHGQVVPAFVLPCRTSTFIWETNPVALQL
jgi:hypothetical protein